MFIGTCNCDPRTLSMSRRGLLCAGGAGFVTALIGTLAKRWQNSRDRLELNPAPTALLDFLDVSGELRLALFDSE